MDNIIEHKNNKMNRIKFNHEQIASMSAVAFFALIFLVMSCTQ